MTIDAALHALAAANTADELIELANKAETLRTYARRAKLGMAAQNRCAELRLRAERKLGEFLTTTARLHGRPKSVPRENTLPSLSDLGIQDRKLSHRAQQLAAIPKRDFELWLRQAHQQEVEITTRDLLAICERRRVAERNFRRDASSAKRGNPRRPRQGLYVGDCLETLATQESASINLIVTSPPYADARRSVYGGIPADQYVGWWLERAEQFRRVLTQDGSLVVNIKEGSEDGERSTHVIELILAMRRTGWLWTEEYIWHKRNCAPGKWPNRFRDAWERCLHFTLDRDFAMYQDAVMIPMGDWAETRLSNLSEIDCIRDPSASGSPFAKNVSNWLGRDLAFPTNVLHFATECGYVGHSACFPEELPEFFIKLFTKEGDLVCDPFLGSGTTGLVANRLNRSFIGIDLLEENIQLAEMRMAEYRPASGCPSVERRSAIT
jgi:site-specific DNA-methyltransferase (adenine-specific)/site-specific DNA-methyltransferase (cytosine-N4-specific)